MTAIIAQGKNFWELHKDQFYVRFTDHVLLTNENVPVNIGIAQVQSSNCKNLLGIKIDSQLDFKDNVLSI